MPPLPVAHGISTLSSGTFAMLSETPGAPQHEYREGSHIGEFEIVAVSPDFIDFVWNNYAVHARVDALRVRPESAVSADNISIAAAVPTASAGVPMPNLVVSGSTRLDTTTPLNSVASTPTSQADVLAAEVHSRPCGDDDGTGNGMVVGRERKLSTKTPFGDSCRWVSIG